MVHTGRIVTRQAQAEHSKAAGCTASNSSTAAHRCHWQGRPRAARTLRRSGSLIARLQRLPRPPHSPYLPGQPPERGVQHPRRPAPARADPRRNERERRSLAAAPRLSGCH
eukprot:scaffold70997_cov60-Phaeocystis_antarctica.AAC.4